MATYYARLSGNVNASNIWATTPSGAAGAVTLVATDVLVANSFTVAVNVDTTVAEVRNDNTGGATASGGFTLNGGVTLRANVIAGGNAFCVTFGSASPNSASIVGNLSCISGAFQSAAQNASSGTLNITGNCTAGNVNLVNGVTNQSAGVVNITGNCTGGTASNAHGAYNASTGTINIVGSVVGGSSNGEGVRNNSAGTINVTGSAVGGTVNNAYGANNNSTGIINIVGSAVASNVSIAAFNTTTGILNVTRAVGNGFGLGSSGMTSQPGVVSNVAGSLTNVEEIEYGSLGQSPTSGPVYLTNKTTNVCLVHRPGLSKKTLISADSTANLLPSASDVRSGTFYNYSNNVGTMNVPSASNVALGVSVGNTTGTAVLNASDIW
ncbi:MAG: hypothetical protein WCO97_05235, partial [bacterium]